MNQLFKALLVFVSLFSLPCAAQRPSLPPVAQIPAKALLLASNGTSMARFGASAAIDSAGDVIVVGAPYQNNSQGGVYIFLRPSTGWANATETTLLTLPRKVLLGYAVAISSDGQTIAASSPQGGTDGVIDIFTPTGGSWSNGGTLSAELSTTDTGVFFGESLAMSTDGQTIVTSAEAAPNYEGTVYVFSKPSGGWTNMTQTAKLTVAVPHLYQGLGYSLAVDGNTVAAGASDNQGGQEGPGEVYVYQKPASGWTDATETAELLASDGQVGDMLGFSVGISGNTIVGGARGHYVGSSAYAGALYVFVKPASGWANAFQNAELTNAAEAGSLGTSAAIEGNFILGGAPNVGTEGHAYGEVCVYVKPAGGWRDSTETYDLTAKPGLGSSASLTTTGPVAISGAEGFSSKGGVFVFEK